jgi:hypothetical protein
MLIHRHHEMLGFITFGIKHFFFLLPNLPTRKIYNTYWVAANQDNNLLKNRGSRARSGGTVGPGRAA